MSNAEILSRDPRVVIFHEFISNAERNHLLDISKSRRQVSTVVSRTDGSSVVSDYRTGFLAMLRAGEDEIVQEIENRIAQVTFTRVAQGEPLQVIGYGKKEQYKAHNDWFDPAQKYSTSHLEKGGQRIKTVMIYLQAPDKGGETEFVNLGIKQKPEPGAALIWDNTYPATGQIDFRLLHAGLPVKKGEKIVATRWIRQRAFNGSENRLSPQQLTEKLCAEQIQSTLTRFNCKMISLPYVAQNGKILAESRVFVNT